MASPQPLEVFVGHQSVARQGPQTVSSPPSTPPMVATPSPVAVRGALVPPRPASVAQPPAGAGTNVHPTSHLQSHAYRSMAHVQQPLQRPHHLPMHAPQPHPAFLGVPVPLLHNHLTGRPGSPTVIDIVPTTLSAGPSAAARAGLTGLVATQTPAQRPQHLTSHLHHHHPHHHQHRGSASDASGASGSTDLNNDPHHPQHSPSPLYDPPSHHAHQDHNMPPSDEKVFQALTPEELAEVRTHPLRMQRKIARFVSTYARARMRARTRLDATVRAPPPPPLPSRSAVTSSSLGADLLPSSVRSGIVRIRKSRSSTGRKRANAVSRTATRVLSGRIPSPLRPRSGAAHA